MPAPTDEQDTERDDTEAVGAFREVLRRAVRCRVRTPESAVGAFLSGGLDSSSVVAVARRVKPADQVLHTYSAVFPDTPVSDESSYIRAVLEAGEQTSHLFNGNTYDPVADLPQILEIHDEPPMAPSSSLLWALFRVASDSTVRVVLDGHGGDEVVSHGYGYEKELARKGNWALLARALFDRRRMSKLPWFRMLLMYWFAFGSLPSIAARWGRTLISRTLHDSRNETGRLLRRVVHPDLAARVDLSERLRTAQSASPGAAATERGYHYRVLTQPSQAVAFEELDRLSQSAGVENRYPFWDRRLVTVCIGLPTALKRSRGQGRYILRRAMRDRLPTCVTERRDKTNFMASVVHNYLASETGMEHVRERIDHYQMEQYVDREVARSVYDQFVREGANASSPIVSVLALLHNLGVWLRGNSSKS